MMIRYCVVANDTTATNYAVPIDQDSLGGFATAVAKQLSPTLPLDWTVFIECPGDRPHRYSVSELLRMR